MNAAESESEFVRSVLEGNGSVCDKAIELVDDARAEFRRFSNLFYIVVAAAAVALVVAIALIVFGQTGSGIATGVSGVVASGAAVFIQSARKTTEQELSRRINSANRICEPDGRTIA